jgi:uncharacterized protein (TIRG00374 family)
VGKNKKSLQAPPVKMSTTSLIQMALIVILFIVLVPQFDSLKASIEIIKTTELGYFLLGVAFSFLGFVWASFTYRHLAWKKLNMAWTFVVQLSTGFLNRVVPAGLGAMGANTLYLIKSGHPDGEAASIAIVNNVLGTVSSALLFLIALFLVGDQIEFDSSKLSGNSLVLFFVTVCVIGIIATVLLRVFPKLRHNMRRYFREAKKSLVRYSRNENKLVGGLFFQILVTLTLATSLLFSAKALGLEINIWQAVIAISVGTLLGAATPTPGGLGGNEAGVALALTLFGISTELAVATAIVYRVCTYWAPILPGYIAYRFALKHGKLL